jgi:hypothetical protein
MPLFNGKLFSEFNYLDQKEEVKWEELRLLLEKIKKILF